MKSVIRWSNLLEMLGFFLLAMSGTILLPWALALAEGDEGFWPLTITVLTGLVAGAALAWFFRVRERDFQRREGMLLVVLTWLAACSLGALPFYFSADFSSFTDAFFESISGFTTTGATILTDIESVPRSLLLWRSLTHWLGGMGIILLGIAILPLIGTGGMELYRAEFSGAVSEKLTPRIAETAIALWRVYALLSFTAFIFLLTAGMGPFDALCHTFATLGTGGFSTRNASLESFANPLIEGVVVVFMFLAGINFTVHYRLIVERNAKRFFGDRELRVYALITLLATLAVTVLLVRNQGHDVGDALLLGAFQVVSILTTTGFSSTDFEQWAPFGPLLLLALMFCGGCTGSTAGGLKVARLDLLFKVVAREFRRLVETRGVFAIFWEGRAVPEGTIQSLLNLVYLAFLINFAACLLLTMFGVPVLTAIAAVAACMFNIGPGLGDVGPAENYAHFHAAVKWILAFCMLAGRLEYYVLIVICTRHFWRK